MATRQQWLLPCGSSESARSICTPVGTNRESTVAGLVGVSFISKRILADRVSLRIDTSGWGANFGAVFCKVWISYFPKL